MNAQRTKKSRKPQTAGLVRPSAPGAAHLFLTNLEDESSELSPKAVLIVLSSLIYRLQREVHSNDLWSLAIGSAKQEALKMGVTENQWVEIMKSLEDARVRARAVNPMASMYP